MILSDTVFRLRSLLRQIWVRISVFSGLALVSGLAAPFLSPLVPDTLRDRLNHEATTDLLSVLSGSMLAVATFSLSVMVTAHHFAASQVTPRTHRLLREDGKTQSVLATFIGAFVYALVTIAVVNAGVYGTADFAVVYATTILVMMLVVVAFVRWVQQISALGSVETTTERVERTAARAIATRARAPFLGALRAEAIPEGAIAVVAERSGYIGNVDTAQLDGLAARWDATVHVGVLPGDWILPGAALMRVASDRLDVKTQEAMRRCVLIEKHRTFDQDPLFGLQVMSEIAQRALSPGLNDPRTAVDVVQRLSRLMDGWGRREDADAPVAPRIRVRPVSEADAVREAFDFVARDGAAMVEVQVAVQEALARIMGRDEPEWREAALAVSRRALARSDEALRLEEDRARARDAAPEAAAGLRAAE